MNKRALLVVVLLLAASALGAGFLLRQRLAQAAYTLTKPTVPPALDADAFPVDVTSTPVVAPVPAPPRTLSTSTPPKTVVTNTPPKVVATSTAPVVPPKELNLAVPFTVQAPHQNWAQPYQDACEEASSLMVAHYFKKSGMGDANAVDAELQKIFAWERSIFGYDKDTTAAETARILTEYYGLSRATVTYDITADDIRAAIRRGHPVIVPAYGKALGNPNFRNGGPLYHMMVVRGYIGTDTFITNDPGTRNGEAYVYKVASFMKALHDWNGGDVPNGRSAMIEAAP